MAGLLSDARHVFRLWRRTRPFWGGLLVISGAGEILSSEQGPFQTVIHIGIQGLAGYLIPVMLLLCGVLLWFNPTQRTFYSLLSILLALGSWITSNLGGFFIGMILGIVGGALAFAWATGSDYRPLKWYRGNPEILLAPVPLELILRPAAALPPAGRAELSSASGLARSAADTPDSAADTPDPAADTPDSAEGPGSNDLAAPVTGTLAPVTSNVLTGTQEAASSPTTGSETLVRVQPPD